MKSVSCWNDLQPFGMIPLTGEACGLMYRILFDVTEKGRKAVAKCFGIPNINLPEPWNRGSAEDPHVGCIMLSQETMQPLAVFALLENGCKEVYLMGQVIVGIEPGDRTGVQRVYKVDYARRFAYSGTAGDRNVHVMSGRVD